MSLGRAILEHSLCLSDEQEAYSGHVQLGMRLRVKGRKVVPARHLYHLLPLAGSAGSWKLLTIDRDLMVAQVQDHKMSCWNIWEEDLLLPGSSQTRVCHGSSSWKTENIKPLYVRG